MNRIFIDWNLTESCAAECPGCTFRKQKVSTLATIPLEIQKTWTALQSVLDSSVHYTHDIVTPLDQLGECDLTALALSPISKLVLNLSRKKDENPHINSILEQVGATVDSALVAVVPTNKPHQFDSNDDISQFISRMQEMFSLQIHSGLSDVTVAFVQNQIPTSLYHPQASAFHVLVKSLNTSSRAGSMSSHAYVGFTQSFMDLVEELYFFQVEDSYFSQTNTHRVSSIAFQYAKFSEYDGRLQWKNGQQQSFSLQSSLTQQIPSLSHSQQLQHARNVNRLSDISLMFTPSSVYLHHSPETVRNPLMHVPHETFQSWLKSISDYTTGFPGLKQVIDEYFNNLK